MDVEDMYFVHAACKSLQTRSILFPSLQRLLSRVGSNQCQAHQMTSICCLGGSVKLLRALVRSSIESALTVRKKIREKALKVLGV
jgi:hypothetical protein